MNLKITNQDADNKAQSVHIFRKTPKLLDFFFL